MAKKSRTDLTNFHANFRAKSSPKSRPKSLPNSRSKSRGQELVNFKLGQSNTTYSFNYDSNLLEAFQNKNSKSMAWTSLICTEFTSLCPKTGQPDFAKIFINYIADAKMIESKSLKLYLFSFRNHGDFHEDCIQTICDDIGRLIRPKFIEVIGEFTPRGGIAIFPYASAAAKEKNMQELLKFRRHNYAPGKYSTNLANLY